MANMQNVADKAGVSVSTVSHVVNKTRFVSEEKRNRVLDAMKALNYQPNRLASSLRRKDKSTRTLGLLVPDSSNPFFADILRGAEDASFNADYNIFLCNSDNSAEKELNYIEALASKQIDGIILVSSGASGSPALLERKNIPTVIVDRSLSSPSYDSVIVDNYAGGKIAAEHLIELGHKRIGCITGPSLLTPSAKRVQGYRHALEEANIVIDEALILQGNFDAHSGYLMAKELLSLPQPPTAIFTCNDMMAIGAIRAANELRVKVPQNLSVIGFDDILLASYTTPSLTTIAQPGYKMGFLAAEILTKRLENIATPIQQKTFTPTLVKRETCQQVKG